MDPITESKSSSEDALLPANATKARSITILFLAANPASTPALRLDEEVRAIDLALRQADFRGCFRLEQHWAVRVTEIQGLLLRFRPDIVHFSGHGSSDNELIFLDDEGNPRAVTPAAFGRLFGILRDSIRCVILNACHSTAQAEAIAQHIDAVVGVSQAIGDEASIQFASAFYQALGFGRSVKSAYDLGRSQVELVNLGEEDALQLIALRADPTQLVFVGEAREQPIDMLVGPARSNRAAMLKLVADFWIEGVLRPSLYREVLIELGMKANADTVNSRLWSMVVHRPQTPSRMLPSSASIGAVFEEMHRSLLILGEPGSGKTTTLLDLARVALLRAEGDPSEPIPVVFNLASWAERRLPLADWLCEELRNKYQIPVGIAKPWIRHDELMLLLDGLDQVHAAHQSDCVKAINAFLDQHLVAVAICCREQDYQILGTPLNVRGAVTLQPLSAEQVQRFLAAAGLQGSSFAKELAQDPILQQLAQFPLMLSIMALAYREYPAGSGAARAVQPDDRRKQIFDLYVAQMLARRTSDGSYSPEQSNHWLACLARGMVQHGQVQFLIENVQPTWLALRSDRWMYAVGFRAMSGLLFLAVCVLAGLLSALVAGNITLAEGLTSGIIAGVLFAVPFLVSSFLATRVRPWLAVILTLGLVAVCTMPFAWSGGLMGGLVTCLVIGLPAALSGTVPSDRLRWSWKKARYGPVLGIGAALIVGLSETLVGIASRAVNDALFAGFIVSIMTLPFLGSALDMTVRPTTVPNQGIRQSLRNALLMATAVFVATLVAMTAAWALWGLVYRSSLAIGLGIGLIFGLPIAVAAGLAIGGIRCLQHLILRVLLSSRGVLPWNCSRFLDTAAERALMRKVGGGYIFVHSSLRDYFAADAAHPDLVYQDASSP